MEEAQSSGAKLLSMMVRCHYLYKYWFIRPSIEDVVKRYNEKHHPKLGTAGAAAGAELAAADGPTTARQQQQSLRRQRQRRWRLVQTPQQQPPQHWLQVQRPLALELELPHFSGASDPRPQSFEPPCYPSTLGKCDVSYLSEPPCYPSTLGRIV